MKILIPPHQHELQDQVIRALSNAGLLHKCELVRRPVASQSNEQFENMLSSFWKDRTVVEFHLVGNKLQCRACGQQIPTTAEGKIDREKLLQQMIAQKTSHPCPGCKQ